MKRIFKNIFAHLLKYLPPKKGIETKVPYFLLHLICGCVYWWKYGKKTCPCSDVMGKAGSILIVLSGNYGYLFFDNTSLK